jgi:hypothetical protein
MSASRLTPAQLADAVARHRDERPNKTLMTNEQRLEAGLMDRHQAAEHEHLASLPQVCLAERVRGPVPDDPWASEPADSGLPVWKAWQAAGHEAMGCNGWSQDGRDDRVVCSCGEVVPLLKAAS